MVYLNTQKSNTVFWVKAFRDENKNVSFWVKYN